jgi:hypothetical protein
MQRHTHHHLSLQKHDLLKLSQIGPFHIFINSTFADQIPCQRSDFLNSFSKSGDYNFIVGMLCPEMNIECPVIETVYLKLAKAFSNRLAFRELKT